MPAGALGARVVAVPLDQTGAVVPGATTEAGVVVVLHEVEVVVVRGLVMVQGQSVMVRVVAFIFGLRVSQYTYIHIYI